MRNVLKKMKNHEDESVPSKIHTRSRSRVNSQSLTTVPRNESFTQIADLAADSVEQREEEYHKGLVNSSIHQIRFKPFLEYISQM